jgi:hypothetical protein
MHTGKPMSNDDRAAKKRKRTKLDNEAIARRIQFLLDEAKSPNPVRDQTVTYAMRVISNFYSIDKDAGSRAVKKNCRRMSRKSLALRTSLSDEEWFKATVNEHQEPLEQVWAWIREGRPSIAQVVNRFKQWPMVTVTREEDADLRIESARRRKHGLSELEPGERYAGIEIVRRCDDGTWPGIDVSIGTRQGSETLAGG